MCHDALHVSNNWLHMFQTVQCKGVNLRRIRNRHLSFFALSRIRAENAHKTVFLPQWVLLIKKSILYGFKYLLRNQHPSAFLLKRKEICFMHYCLRQLSDIIVSTFLEYGI